MRSYKILLFIASAVLLLALLCFTMPSDGLEIAGLKLRFPSIEKMMTREEQFDMEAFLAAEQHKKDSIEQLLTDTTEYYIALLGDSSSCFYLPDGDYTFFDSAFARMESAQSRGRTVRVLHYGDSQIEMDHITSRLRATLQAQFSGGGPGLLPLGNFTPVTAAQVWVNGSYQKLSSFGDSTVSRSAGNYGPMMQCHRINGPVSAGVRPSAHQYADSLVKRFDHIRVVFNNRGGLFEASLTVPSMHYTASRNTDATGVQCFDWQLDSCADRLNFKYVGNADFYGAMVDCGHGVAVDNIPMRGCSGHQFKTVSESMLRNAYDLMDVAVIIMQFGGNSVPYLHGTKSIANYCHELGQQIDYLHTCCPDATIVFIGPSDMTATGGEIWQTYSALPDIVAQLRDSAMAHGAAYWSIYHAMGGWNSMKTWVQKGYAGKDYMHFTQKGADIMGDRLADALMKQYEYYRFRMRHLQNETNRNEPAGDSTSYK